MKRYHTNHGLIRFSMVLMLTLLAARLAAAQGSAFAYQGRLTDGDNPADGLYDMQFRLFDTSTVGTGIQQGQTITNSSVQVTNGGFSVELDFGAGVFNGAARFLEISVRPAGSPEAYNVLSPRQVISSTPYALRSAVASDAVQLSGITASGFIQNSAAQQTATNFNISGDGTAGGTLSAGTINAATQYNIAGSRVLSVAGTDNFFVGIGAGQAISTGSNNSFFGRSAGLSTATGSANSFFGDSAGSSNITGRFNSFFGAGAGSVNTADLNSFFGAFTGGDNMSGTGNSFFGYSAGRLNRTGNNNAFFGSEAGFFNTASGNSFFGASAGFVNTTGANNSFFGAFAGDSNTTGQDNSFFGFSAGAANTTGVSNSFFGRSAGLSNTTGGNNSFFGRDAGNSNTTGNNNTFFGSSAGGANTTASNNSFFGRSAGVNNTTGSNNTFIGISTGSSNSSENNNTFIGFQAEGIATITNATAIGANAMVAQSNSLVLGSGVNVGIGTSVPADRLHVNGIIRVISLGASGSTQLCRNASNQIATCSSSLRYKDRVTPFGSGLEIIDRLRPITFAWKSNGERDLGLVAEEVAAIEPLLVTYNSKGEVEGVKYDRIAVLLINAIKQLQAEKSAETKSLREENAALRNQNADLDARLKALEQKMQINLQPDNTPDRRRAETGRP